MALKQTKIFYNKLKGRNKHGNEEKPLIKNRNQKDAEQICIYMERSDQSGVYPDLIAPNVEVSGKTVLNILRNILSEQLNDEELDNAVEVLKKWSKLNGVTTDKKEGSFPQNWLCEYLQEVNQFVEKHFPSLPVEGSPERQLQEFLKNTQSMICNEVLRLTPVLEDAGLLVHLIDSYSRHLFTKLDLLLNRDLSVNETFSLLLWGKYVYFSPDSQHVFRVCDPLLLTGWFEKATKKLLPKLKNEISKNLLNILCDDEQHDYNKDSMDEETFMSVHIDVIQYLNAVVKNSEAFSKTLMCKTRALCLEELHHFVQKYVDGKKKQLKNWEPLNTNSVYLFRLISTCRRLRFFAPQLNNPDINNSDNLLNIISTLEELEDHVWSIVQKMMKHIAQDHLRRYFKSEDEQIYVLTEAIQNHCASLPQNDVGKEVQEIFVNVAYDCVSHVYLDCLMKSKIKRLEKRWGNVGERMREDALNFQNTFSQLGTDDWLNELTFLLQMQHGNGNDEQKNSLLQRLSEVLICSDVDPLKLTCCCLFEDFPKDSDQYVSGLLRWKGELSERQVREILDVTRDLRQDPNPKCVTCHPLKGLCCFLLYK